MPSGLAGYLFQLEALLAFRFTQFLVICWGLVGLSGRQLCSWLRIKETDRSMRPNDTIEMRKNDTPLHDLVLLLVSRYCYCCTPLSMKILVADCSLPVTDTFMVSCGLSVRFPAADRYFYGNKWQSQTSIFFVCFAFPIMNVLNRASVYNYLVCRSPSQL